MTSSPSDFIEIAFEPEKEVWNLYELNDGTLLRIRTQLLKLFRQVPQPGQPASQGQYSVSFTNIQTISKVSPALKGAPNANPLTPEELQSSPRTEIQFTQLSEDWNVYRLETQEKLKVKLVVSQVFRLRERFDQFGDPVYLSQSQNVIQPIPRQSATG